MRGAGRQAGDQRQRRGWRKGAEREDLWNQLAEIYPPYLDYQKYAGDREIPVVVLEPIG